MSKFHVFLIFNLSLANIEKLLEAKKNSSNNLKKDVFLTSKLSFVRHIFCLLDIYILELLSIHLVHEVSSWILNYLNKSLLIKFIEKVYSAFLTKYITALLPKVSETKVQLWIS